MALTQIIDVTTDFNSDGLSNIDISNWDWVTIQLVTPAAAVNFLGSNDGSGITGVTDGNPTSATNFTPIQAINLSTGVGATSGTVAGLWRLPVTSRYLQLSGTTATKILLYLSKIS